MKNEGLEKNSCMRIDERDIKKPRELYHEAFVLYVGEIIFPSTAKIRRYPWSTAFAG